MTLRGGLKLERKVRPPRSKVTALWTRREEDARESQEGDRHSRASPGGAKREGGRQGGREKVGSMIDRLQVT